MVKQLLKILASLVIGVAPMTANAMPNWGATEVAQEQLSNVRISVQGQNIRVQQAQGKVLEVYSVTGAKVLSVQISASDETIKLPVNKGCYIVKVGDVTRKISIL